MSKNLDLQDDDLDTETPSSEADQMIAEFLDSLPEHERAAYADDEGVDDGLIDDSLNAPAADTAPDPVAPPDTADDALIDVEAHYVAADATLSDLYDEHADLGRQLDEGEIGEGKYQAELLKLNRQIEKAQAELDAIEGVRNQQLSKADQTRQAEEQKFSDAVGTFLAQPENASIVEGSPAWNVLDAQIKMLASVLPPNTPYEQLLAKARQATAQIVDLPVARHVPTTKPQRKNAMPPPTLSSMPAAATNESGGEFDHIEKLSGLQYERAISQLSAEQRNRLLMGG